MGMGMEICSMEIPVPVKCYVEGFLRRERACKAHGTRGLTNMKEKRGC